jgi:hypothetical protein
MTKKDEVDYTVVEKKSRENGLADFNIFGNTVHVPNKYGYQIPLELTISPYQC